jgi:hypothetical protein
MSDFDDITSWTLKKVQLFLDTYHIEYDCLEEDELRCLAYSLPIERDKVVQAELMTVFPLDADLIDSLLESTSYIVTKSLISELKELCEFQNQDEGLYNNDSLVPINFSSSQSIDKFPRIAAGSTVIAEENEGENSGLFLMINYPVCLTICVSVCLFTYLSICLSVSIIVCLFVN